MTGSFDADVVVLTSRFAPEKDGGYAVAVMSRLLAVQRAGASPPLLLTLDAGPPHDREHAAAFAIESGMPSESFTMRNLFDEALRDPRWLSASARPGEPTPGLAYRQLRDDQGTPVLSLPVINDPSGWYLSEANVVIHDGDRDLVLSGFGELYVAWLSHVAEGLRAAAGDDERQLVVICESRQVGEVLHRWRDPRVRIVHTVHNSHLASPFDRSAPLRDDGWRRWLEGMDNFDLVVWPTHAQRSEVDQRFPHRVPFASVPSAILPRPSRRAAPRRSADVVIMACRLVDQKRVDLAVRAWEEVVRLRPRARLDVYGNGPLRDRLAALIRERGLERAVRLRGHSDDVRTAMEQARAFLSTSAFEGQGLAIIEAMSAGLPVVSFDVRYGPAEIIGDGGILVAPDDVSGIARAIVALLEDDDRWEHASAHARRAAARFAPEVVGRHLLSELDAVLAVPASRLCALAEA
ncbi:MULTISPECIES: glycosyltransferase [Microbacterium]|jgi:poly(glycerol-phosphate) alpha-glucosyltransferase|uniref:glycosyltransferase n=1 Tax=Microbacterium TaxID=33882 RepID=UPI001D179A0A|nr:glycosyltransferase [Microbacterium testaceum]MCC4250350.1 glycosyltransferase [Microbacterium testaceum]